MYKARSNGLQMPASTYHSNRQSLAFPVVESFLRQDQSHSPVPHTKESQAAHEPSAYSQMLVVEIEQHLIATLILLPGPLILEVATGSHPAMHLVAEGLNVVFYGQGLAEFLHRVGVLVAGCEHADGYFDALGVGGIDHGGVDFGDGGEGSAGLGG